MPVRLLRRRRTERWGYIASAPCGRIFLSLTSFPSTVSTGVYSFLFGSNNVGE